MVTIEDRSELDEILEQIHSDEFKLVNLQDSIITSEVILGFTLVPMMYLNSGSRKAHHERKAG